MMDLQMVSVEIDERYQDWFIDCNYMQCFFVGIGEYNVIAMQQKQELFNF